MIAWIAPVLAIVQGIIAILIELKKPPSKESFTHDMAVLRKRRRNELREKLGKIVRAE